MRGAFRVGHGPYDIFMANMNKLDLGSLVKVPVVCILFAHSGIDSRMMLQNSTHAGKSMYYAVHDLWMNRHQ